MKKLTAWVLLAVLLLGTVSCGNSTVNTPENTTSADTQISSDAVDSVVTEVEEKEVTASSMITEKFGGQNYDGREFRILGFDVGGHFANNISNTFMEVWAEEYNGEIINDAIYDRNAQASELLNITIVPQLVTTTSEMATRIKQAVSAAADDFDVALQSLSNLGTTLQNNELANFKKFPTLDTSSPWYDQNSVETFTLFGEKLYWLTGDYMLLDDYAVHVIFFNKNLVTNAGQELPYDTVREGDWTLDKFCAMTKAAELDVNGDGKMVIGTDIVAHLENHDKIKHWVYGCRERSITINEDKTLEIDTLSERQVNVVERLYHYTVEEGMTYSISDDSQLSPAFKSGLATSYCIALAYINQYRDMPDDFGIVPMPKYDEMQEEYGHYISNYAATALCCPLTVSDREFVGTCIETLSAFSTETVNTALYDVLLTSKLVRDQESVEMLEIALSTKYYDWAVDFPWGSTFEAAYNGVYDKKTFNYVSAATSALKAQKKLLERLIDNISEFED
ncbi:MAG: hypothetical protein IKU40_07795 [Clostridia bacterium]|nr:hypothetical protein [Clostridia bacterium]